MIGILPAAVGMRCGPATGGVAELPRSPPGVAPDDRHTQLAHALPPHTFTPTSSSFHLKHRTKLTLPARPTASLKCNVVWKTIQLLARFQISAFCIVFLGKYDYTFVMNLLNNALRFMINLSLAEQAV